MIRRVVATSWVRPRAHGVPITDTVFDVDEALRALIACEGSDLHLKPGAAPRARVHGELFTNTTPRLAFFLNPQVIRDGEEVLPSYWSDNYFSIPARGSVTVRVSCPAGSTPQLRLEGWNIAATTRPLTID